MWWIIVIGMIVPTIYRLIEGHDEYVDKHITSFSGMRVRYEPLIGYLAEPQGVRMVKEASKYIAISSSCRIVDVSHSTGDLITSLKGGMPLTELFSKKWVYPSEYPQDEMIEKMESYMTWLIEEYQRLNRGQDMEYHLSFGLHKAKLPIISTEIKEQYPCLILGTGSTYNLIDNTVIEYFKDIVGPVGDYYISGMGGTKHKIGMITLPFSLEGQVYKPRFCVGPLLDAFKSIRDESGVQVHGLIGTDFLLKNKWVINLERLELIY